MNGLHSFAVELLVRENVDNFDIAVNTVNEWCEPNLITSTKIEVVKLVAPIPCQTCDFRVLYPHQKIELNVHLIIVLRIVLHMSQRD